MKVLITGGTGYIGSHTVLALHEAGFQPVIVDSLANSSRAVVTTLEQLTGTFIPFYETNYADSTKLRRILRDENIEAVIHFAAYKAVAESVEQPLTYYQNNVSGFVGMLQLLLEQGVEHFVFSSSAAVYGNPPTAVVTEETPCHPESPYGWSKYMDEVILRDTCAANPKFHGTALRYFNVVGADPSGKIGESPKGRPQNLLPIIVQAVTGKIPEVTVFGTDYPTVDGTCLRDYIHVSDLARAHVAALQASIDKSDGNYDVYNVGTGEPTSVLELITTFEKINDVKVPHTLGPRRAGDPFAYSADVSKIAAELGWKAEKTVEDAVRDAWNWQTTHPDGYTG